MFNNKIYPLALILIIGAALYILYGDTLLPKQADLSQYRDVCLQYRNAPKGTYTDAELKMMVAEVNYLVPSGIDELVDPTEKELRGCADVLNSRLKN